MKIAKKLSSTSLSSPVKRGDPRVPISTLRSKFPCRLVPKAMNGFFLIDKEKGMTSFNVVRNIRKIVNEKKVGHAGTLDPLATGLLIIGIGEGTKMLESVIGKDKEYEVLAHFGYVSSTYDGEGEILPIDIFKKITKREVLSVINKNFLGKISQVPPKYSAVKILGRHAYDIARKGEDFTLNSREIEIYQFDILSFGWPLVKFKIKCSSGTYIRSLVHDLGQILKIGAYVKELRRTFVGDFNVNDSVNLDMLNKNFERHLISLEKFASNFNRIKLSSEEFNELNCIGILLNKKYEQKFPAMAFYNNKLIGILELFRDNHYIKFKRRIFA